MGDIADQMLEGSMCQVCGVYMHEFEAAPGYPVTCASCDEGPAATAAPARKKSRRRVDCDEPGCERLFRTKAAMEQHWLDKHG